jgi:mRNA interferase YafQ
MKYALEYESKFKSDFKKCIKRKINIKLIEEVIFLLHTKGSLPPKYKTHQLKGNWKGFKECHIKSDLLLIWFQDDESRTIVLTRIGKHDDLF